MARSFWCACLLVTASVAPAPPASAIQPSPAHSTIPGLIRLVGHGSGQPDPAGRFEITVRSLGSMPLANVHVVLELASLTDLRLTDQVAGAGATVDCPTATIRGFTNAQGVVAFSIVGAAQGPAQCFGANGCPGQARVYADGVILGDLRVAAFDLDGSGGVGGGDCSIWLQDFGGGLDPARSDYDGNGAVDGADLSLWLAHFGSGGSAQSAATYCP